MARHKRSDYLRIKEEVIEKVNLYDSTMESFFGEWLEASNSWRMIPNARGRGSRGLFNSKSGETTRATNTLASLWFRMLTASDPYLEIYPDGIGPFGRELSEEELYATREILVKQAEFIQYKPKLLKTLRSLALIGTVIVEKPFMSVPLGMPNEFFEATDFQFRSLLRTGFDPYCFDLDFSDFIYTVDYLTKFRLNSMAQTQEGVWFKDKIQSVLDKKNDSSEEGKFVSDSFSNILERKQRAGYNDSSQNFLELINYHGKLDTNNDILIDIWEQAGRQDDINMTDWTTGVLDGEECVRLHPTAYGSWKYVFETASINQFELEPIGYGVGKFGRRTQRELDHTQSVTNDALIMAVYSMWKIGKFAGLNENQISIRPFNLIALDDITQLEQLRVDMNTIVQSLSMQGFLKEDFRTINNAQSNLQAVNTSATATEASLTQTEAIRGNSVQAEIIAETLVRGYFKTAHLNNYNLLDYGINVNVPGPRGNFVQKINRYNIPANIGLKIKVTTDKDYTPEKLKKILEMINLATSIRQVVPESINAVPPLFDEGFRLMGLDPRLLRKPKPMADLLTERAQRLNSQGPLSNQVEGEVAGEQVGSNNITTPLGPIPTSPLSSALIQGA